MKKAIKTSLRVVITLPVFILLGIVHGLSQVPAFPRAEGFGKNATGGRGGKIIFVTNLNDSGEGSLRATVEETGRRTVLFKVGGVINLRSTLTIANPDITIAGQSAPGNGICLKSNGSRGIYLMNIKTNNVIVRHIKFRRGPSTEGGECNGDALAMLGAQNCIIDHCSFSWTTDELISSWPAQNITVQWCTFAEALHNSTHSDDCDPGGPLEPHALGPLMGNASDKITFYRNLFANNTGRNPQISPTEGGQFQLINNVVYNTCYAMSLAGKNGNEINVNAIGNYIKWGPNSCDNNRNNILLSGNTKVYVEDNLTPFRSEGDDQWLATSEFRKQTPARTIFQADRPFAMPEVPTISAANAYREVPLQAGAIKVSNAEGAIIIKRDPVDQRTLADVTSGTATSGTSGRRLDHPDDVGGWPTYASGTPPADSDNDGMPDAWENKYGLNPNNAADNNKDTDGDGYLNVEEFLNETDPTGGQPSEVPSQGPGRIEAEAMALSNYRTADWKSASEKSIIAVKDLSQPASATYRFTGSEGRYSISVRYRDEIDGASSFTLLVNNAARGAWTADQVKQSPDQWKTFIANGIYLKKDARISIRTQADFGEPARLDYVEVTGGNELSSVVGPSNAAASRLAQLRIYPNPASNQLIVEGKHDYQVSLYDLTGRPLMQRDHLSGRTTLDVSHLRSGVYLMKAQDAQGQLNQQRIVVE